MGKYEDECYKRYFDFLCEVDKRPKNINVVMSKRQLNIAKEAEKRYLGRPLHQYYSAEDLAKAFRDGAKWADEHPNLESLWHDASEKPRAKEWILVQFEEDEYETLALSELGVETWSDWWCDNYKVIRYAYITDLLPKGGEK